MNEIQTQAANLCDIRKFAILKNDGTVIEFTPTSPITMNSATETTRIEDGLGGSLGSITTSKIVSFTVSFTQGQFVILKPSKATKKRIANRIKRENREKRARERKEARLAKKGESIYDYEADYDIWS